VPYLASFLWPIRVAAPPLQLQHCYLTLPTPRSNSNPTRLLCRLTALHHSCAFDALHRCRWSHLLCSWMPWGLALGWKASPVPSRSNVWTYLIYDIPCSPRHSQLHRIAVPDLNIAHKLESLHSSLLLITGRTLCKALPSCWLPCGFNLLPIQPQTARLPTQRITNSPYSPVLSNHRIPQPTGRLGESEACAYSSDSWVCSAVKIVKTVAMAQLMRKPSNALRRS